MDPRRASYCGSVSGITGGMERGEELARSRSSSTASTTRSTTGSMGSMKTAGNGKFYNPVVMSFIRDDWIQQQLHLRQAQYTIFQPIKVVTGTWNVNAKKPLSLAEANKIVEWIQFKSTIPSTQSPASSTLPDIVAVGFQEIVDLNAVNVVVNSALTVQRSSAWEEVILTALNNHIAKKYPHQSLQYKVVLEKHLVGILLVIFVRTDHLDHVKDVRGATAGVGIMGMMGNKGGVAIRMGFYDSTLCFVCSHLAAHRENVAGRNADYHNILSKIDFGDGSNAGDEGGCGSSASGTMNDTRFLSGDPPILNHDFVFWLGDLNYRIIDEMSVEKVFHCAESGDNNLLSQLRQLDQLNNERQRGSVLQGFEEGELKFPPTYKFQAGTSIYEKRPEKKLRAPAWCDRVLWKSKNPSQATLTHYDAVMALDLSDHKPVQACFDIQVKHQVDTKKNQIIRDIILQLDKWENENMPKVRLLQSDGVTSSSGVLGFSHLKYGIEQSKTIVIENTGLVVAHFRFIPKLEEVTVCKPWLRISPIYGMIPPKEKIDIQITAQVDEAIAHGLTSGEETLDDTMILRVENGRDFFLVVSGEYDNSCFGASLEQLVGCTHPIRQTACPSATPGSSSMFSVASSSSSSSSSSLPNPQRIPKELWRMVNDLYLNHMKERNLFGEPGDKKEVALLREALDTGAKFPPHSGHSSADLLLSWLHSLRQSVVPDEILASALANGNGNVAQSARNLLDDLPPVRYNTMIYLIAFLKELLQHANTNNLTPEKLAAAFSRCLVSPCTVVKNNSRVRAASYDQSPPFSSSSTASTASSNSNQSSIILSDEKLRRATREFEVAQWNAAQRAEKLEKLLVHLLTIGVGNKTSS